MDALGARSVGNTKTVFLTKVGQALPKGNLRYTIAGCVLDIGPLADLQKSLKLKSRAKKFSDSLLVVEKPV